MKKSLIAVAVAAALPAAAFAQQAGSSVTLYGIIDAAVASESGGAVTAGTGNSRLAVQSGVQSGNRFGIRGREDLGGGMFAEFVLENGFGLDSGAGGLSGNNNPITTATPAGAQQPAQYRIFGREARVSLGGNFGRVSFGRLYTPGFYFLLNTDPMTLGFYGATGAFTGVGLTGTAGQNNVAGSSLDQVRWDNSIEYLTPNFGGFTGRFTYSSDFTQNGTTIAGNTGEGLSTGAGVAPATNKAGRAWAAGGRFQQGPIDVHAVYHSFNADFIGSPANVNVNASNRAYGIGGSFDFGVARAFAGYFIVDPIANFAFNKQTSYWLGAQARLGPGTLHAIYARATIDALNNAADPKSTTFGVAYQYPLSRRTNVYASFGTVRNNSVGNFGLGTSQSTAAVTPNAVGSDPRGIAVGVRHQF